MKPYQRTWMMHPWTLLIVLIRMPATIVAMFGLAAFLGAWRTSGPWQALWLALQFCSTPGILVAFAPPVLGALAYSVLIRWGSIPNHAQAADRPLLLFEGLD